jgi:SH3-like domain-containing protein
MRPVRSIVRAARCIAPAVALVCAFAAASAAAADFRSIQEGGTIMYDAPSAKGRKLYVASRDYPVEVLVNVEGWSRVRDAAGELVWVERKSLSEKRTVLVTAHVADVRSGPADQSALAFRAQQGIALDLAEPASGAWTKVRLRDGRTGYVRIGQVWGL